MSDLSRLLDDVYGTSAAPSWANVAAEAFSGWDTTPVEEERLEIIPDPAEALEAILDLGKAVRSPAPEPAAVAAPLALAPPWVPSDDDILPAKAIRRRLRLGRR